MVVPVHYTVATKTGQWETNLSATGMTSVSVLLKTTTADTIDLYNLHRYDELTFSSLDHSLFSQKQACSHSDKTFAIDRATIQVSIKS